MIIGIKHLLLSYDKRLSIKEKKYIKQVLEELNLTPITSYLTPHSILDTCLENNASKIPVHETVEVLREKNEMIMREA